MKITIITAIFSLLLCSPIAHAQDTKAADAARREKAFELLESLATQVASLQSPENRARIGANIADSLWTHNENRARAMFISIEDDIKIGFQDRDVTDPGDELTTMVFLKLRADIVQRIAKYDPEFALDFLNATELKTEDAAGSFASAQRDLEVQLAKQIVAANPDLALKLGRQSLAHGFSDQLLSVLRQLHRKHRDKGVTLYKETVQKLRDADFSDDWEAVEFACSLVESFAPPVADESAFRELVNTLITAALARKCDKKPKTEDDEDAFCDRIASLVATMQKVDPVRARRLKHLTPNPDEQSWQSMERPYTELEEVAQDGSVEEILGLAEKYPAMDVSVYSRAIAKAIESGDVERAKKIASSYPGESEVREMLVAQMRFTAVDLELTEEQVAQYQVALEQIPQDQNRILALSVVASRVGAKHKTLALKLLDQAFELVERMKAPAGKIEMRLNLAMSYCTEGSDRGLQIVESQIPKLNELVEAAVKLDGFDTNYMRDGEWNMSANGSIGNILTRLSQNAGHFAWCDFDRAVSLAAQFERSEIRMMAQVKLAQSILAGPPSRNRNRMVYQSFSL